MKQLYSFGLFVFLISFFFTPNLYATHNMGKDLQYQCLGVVGGNVQYRVTVRYYRNCWDNSFGGQAASAPTSVSLNVLGTPCGYSLNTTLPRDANAVPPNGTEVSQLCSSQLSSSGCNWTGSGNPPYPGVEVYTFTGIVSVPVGCSQVTFGTDECCRNGSINNIPNPGSLDLSITATVNNAIDTNLNCSNNSVTFTNQPVPFFCLGSDVTFNHGAVDVDGDSLVYSLVNPMQGTNLPYTNINFSAGYSVNQPIRTSPPNTFQFDPQTGQMEFVPGFQEQCVLAVRIDEYRNGVWVGSTMRDIQVVILPCAIAIPDQNAISNVQNGNQVDSFTVQVCPGTPLIFDIECTDPANHNLTVTSNINGTPSAIPGATMTQVGTGDTVTARIQWTPLPADTGCHDFVLTAKNNDCPINGSNVRVYSICVFTKVQLLSVSPTFCGSPVQLTATGGTNYTWTPSTGPNAVSNPNIYNPTVSPVSPTMYYFSSDCGTDSVFVDSDPPFIYDAGLGGSICQNGQVYLNATTDNLYAPYHFQWVPSTGLVDPVSGLPNDTIPNPVASPLSTTQYKCYITGTNGCTNVDSLTVNVSNAGPNIVAQAQPTAVCPGDPVQLNIVTNPQSCGLTTTPCQGHYAQAQVGNGTGQTPTGSPTQYPTIYGHYSNSARHQFLYLQNELLALLGSGGSIDSIAFYVSQINTVNDTMKNFEIKMGCTQETSLNNWQPNLVTVFTPKSVAVGSSVGWKVHRLDSPYDWDGTSNLVVDICFNNPTSSTLNNKMQMTPTSFNSVYYSRGSTSQCGNTGTPQPSVNRPNTRFNACITDVNGLPIAWTPASGPNAPAPIDIVNPVAHPQTPEIYRVDVTAANGCHSQDFVYVDVDTSVRFNAFPDDTFFCSVTALNLTTVTYGSPIIGSFNYEFRDLTNNSVLYSGTQNSFSVTPSSTTDYLITITGGSCVLRDTVHVIIGNDIPISLVVDSIDCFGQTNGKVVAIPGGGTPPINYLWSTSAAIDSIQNLGPGTYSVSITDSQGCSGDATVTLSQPAQLSVTATAQNNLCNGANSGIVSLTVSGGTPAYSFTWNPVQPNDSVATGLGPGNYSATVTDAHGCTASASATLSDPPVLSVNVLSYNATSNGGNEGWAYAIASGGTPGYTYSWSNGSPNDTISNLYAGVYYVTVCDANNCCRFDTAVVTDPPPIILTFVTVNNSCFGDCNGSSSVSATGGIVPYSFLWSQGGSGNSIANLCAGAYTVTATDSAGVSVLGNILITEPSQVTLQLDTVDISCFGASDGQALAIANGGTGPYSFNWSPGGNVNPNVSLNSGTYSVVATDVNGCTAQAAWTAVEPALLVVSLSAVTNVSCYGGTDGTATASVSGGTPTYTYDWSNITLTSNPGTGFSAGSQSITVTDAHSCTASATFSITEPTQLVGSIISVTDVTCYAGNNGSVDLSVSGATPPYYFAWSNGFTSEDISGVSAGVHTVTVTDANSCSTTTSARLTEPAIISLSFNHTDPLCTGDANGSATVVTSGGSPSYTIDWSNTSSANDNATITNLISGTYTVTVTDANTCTMSGSVTLVNPVSLNAQLINKEEISCANAQDGSIEVSASGGTPPLSYLWSNSVTSSINNNLPPGTYNVTVEDVNGCDTTLNVTFLAPPPISIALINIDSASCPTYSDGVIQVSAIGGTPGLLGYEYSLDGITFQSSEFFASLAAGSYHVRIRDGEGCFKDTTVFIHEPLMPTLTVLPQDSTIALGQSIVLSSSISTYSGNSINFYSWSPITGLNCGDCSVVSALPYANTTYTLTVNYLSDCSVSETVTVYVGDGVKFFVPTAFSPNGDGNNDVFEVYGTGLSKVNMKIFNRWGEKIFDSSNQWRGWDGSYRGEMQNPGVYTYVIEGVYLNGNTAQEIGSITLIR